MARGRAKRAPEPEVDEDEDGPQNDPTDRDFVMARLAAARAALQLALDGVDEALAMFLDPDEDRAGKERADLISGALECAGTGSRALECADEAMADIDPTEGEPWEE